jgi:hypothetical protein
MARATCIYVVKAVTSNLLAAFTVKWEAQEWIEKQQPSTVDNMPYQVLRFPDGRFRFDRAPTQVWTIEDFLND